MLRILALGILVTALPACQLTSSSGVGDPWGSTAWADLPVPRGFRPLESPDAEVPVAAGDYRAGEFRFRGRGRVEDVQAYYDERMPLQGWAWDADRNAWTKGATEVSVNVNPYDPTASSGLATQLDLLLHVASDRNLAQG